MLYKKWEKWYSTHSLQTGKNDPGQMEKGTLFRLPIAMGRMLLWLFPVNRNKHIYFLGGNIK